MLRFFDKAINEHTGLTGFILAMLSSLLCALFLVGCFENVILPTPIPPTPIESTTPNLEFINATELGIVFLNQVPNDWYDPPRINQNDAKTRELLRFQVVIRDTEQVCLTDWYDDPTFSPPVRMIVRNPQLPVSRLRTDIPRQQIVRGIEGEWGIAHDDKKGWEIVASHRFGKGNQVKHCPFIHAYRALATIDVRELPQGDWEHILIIEIRFGNGESFQWKYAELLPSPKRL